MAEVISVNDTNFQNEVLDSNLPVIVDFSATWCGPCKMLAPIIEELANQYKDKLKVCKSDIDESNQTATKLGIMAVPTIIFFKDGKETERMTGVLPKDQLVQKIEDLLK